KELENKAEIDRVIDEICALFCNKELGGIWTPHHLYFKFMELLPNRMKKTEDVLSVSFWPP
ncbi:resistance protein, partial [Trifolium medium]|nr:resistance protein [Trifolium medium]